MITPPHSNVDVSNWDKDENNKNDISTTDKQLEDIRMRLEKLL